jgi:V8-like Glu-specific endopeptidase
MLFRALFLSLFAALTLSSCAKEEAAPAANTGGAYTIPVETLAQGQKIAQEAVLECGADCSPSVGLLAFATPENAGQCSAFLVADDTIATNSHCIPEDLKEPGTSCKNRLWMHFAKDGSKETRIACDKIIYDSKNFHGIASEPDYAYVKLAKASTRPFLRITRDGFPEGATMTIQKVNPVRHAGRMKGMQQRVSCRTVQNSNSLQSFFHALAPVAMVTECEVIHGNSGSPVLAQDGSVRGVVFAYQDPEDIKAVFAKNKKLRLKEGLTNLNFAANFACLRGADGTEGDRFPNCASHIQNLRQHLSQKGLSQTAKLSAELEKQVATVTALADFRWASRFEKSDLEISLAYAGVQAGLQPKCVKAAAAARYASDVSVNLPKWTVMEEYDRYLRGTTVLGPRILEKTKIRVFVIGADEFTVLITGKDSVQKFENLPGC